MLVRWKCSRTRTKIDILIPTDCASVRGVRAEPPGSTRGHVPDAEKNPARSTTRAVKSTPRRRSLRARRAERRGHGGAICCTRTPPRARTDARARWWDMLGPRARARGRRGRLGTARRGAGDGNTGRGGLVGRHDEAAGARVGRARSHARRIFFSVRHVSPRASRRLCAHPTGRSAICRN